MHIQSVVKTCLSLGRNSGKRSVSHILMKVSAAPCLFVALLLASVMSAYAVGDSLGIAGEKATSIGIYIKDISSGRILVERNSQTALMPASVMKAVTTASVLSLEGGEKRFETKVVLRGHRDGSRWCGDLVVHAAADPTLESHNFKSYRGFCDSIVAALRHAGITSISGTIIVSESLKDAGPVMQWELADIAWPYGCGLYGFNWRDNTVTVYPNTGRTVPEAPGFTIEVKRADEGNDMVRGVNSNKLTVYSDNTKKDMAVSAAVPDPAAVFGAQLTDKLRSADIAVHETAASDADDPETALYTHLSAPYSEIMHSLMVRSDNLFAEGMLRTLAPQGSRKDAIERQKQLWNSRGIDSRYTNIDDGCGLSRTNRLSPHFIGDILEWMAKSPQSAEYVSFFPRAGKEGTMRGTLARSPLKGLIALKTGSVSKVQCYAGYKLDDSGKPTHVIVFMANGFFCSRGEIRKAAERLLESVFL